MILYLIIFAILLTLFLAACSTIWKPAIERQKWGWSILWHLWRLEKTMPDAYIEKSVEGLTPNDYENEIHADKIRREIVAAVQGGEATSDVSTLHPIVEAYLAEVEHVQELEAIRRQQIEEGREHRERAESVYEMEERVRASTNIRAEIEARVRSDLAEKKSNKKRWLGDTKPAKKKITGRQAWVKASALAKHKEQE